MHPTADTLLVIFFQRLGGRVNSSIRGLTVWPVG